MQLAGKVRILSENQATPAVVLAGVAFTYRGAKRAALSDISLSWPRGFTALLGPNGAGKSTLMSLVVGDRKLQQGSLEVEGRVGYVPQRADWPGQFTIEEFLDYAAWLQSVSAKARNARVQEAMEALDLVDLRRSTLRSLSGGQHRRAMIAQALLANPSVLVLDEPSASLDPKQRAQLRDLLATISEHRSVVAATHLVEDVENVADWVTMIDGGRVVWDGSMEGLRCEYQQGDQERGVLERAYLDLVS